MENIQNMQYGRMSAEHSHQIKERTSDVSSRNSVVSKTLKYQFLDAQSGTMQEKSWETATVSHGGNLMLSIGEFPKEENVSTLSQILEVGVPEKYYLSQKACLGILRRASERGKKLPDVLQKALERQALIMPA